MLRIPVGHLLTVWEVALAESDMDEKKNSNTDVSFFYVPFFFSHSGQGEIIFFCFKCSLAGADKQVGNPDICVLHARDSP